MLVSLRCFITIVADRNGDDGNNIATVSVTTANVVIRIVPIYDFVMGATAVACTTTFSNILQCDFTPICT